MVSLLFFFPLLLLTCYTLLECIACVIYLFGLNEAIELTYKYSGVACASLIELRFKNILYCNLLGSIEDLSQRDAFLLIVCVLPKLGASEPKRMWQLELLVCAVPCYSMPKP